MVTPKGVGPAFVGNPGKRSLAEHGNRLVAAKLAKLPADVGAVAVAASAQLLGPQIETGFVDMVERLAKQAAAGKVKGMGERHIVGCLTPNLVKAVTQRLEMPSSAVIDITDKKLAHMIRLAKVEKNADISLDDIKKMAQIIQETDMVYWDNGWTGEGNKPKPQALIYAFDLGSGDAGKFAVRINFVSRVRIDGKKQNIKTNHLVSGGITKIHNLEDTNRYERLEP